MADILFSIIIPHYNIPECLRRLLDSIPDKPEIEVIVVDDKSNKELDKLEQCIADYKSEKRSFYFNDTDKKGAGVCRNIGIEHAKGKWLLFADSDDFFTEDMYSTVESCVDMEEDIIFFFPTSIDFNTGKLSDRHVEFCSVLEAYLKEPSEARELVLRYQMVSPWSKLIRRKMVVDNGITFEDTRVANDVLFCRKIGFWAKKIAVDSRTIYTVSERSGSLTTFIDKDAYYTRLGVFIRSTLYIKEMAGKQILKKMNFNGSYFLHMCRVNKLGVAVIIKTICLLLKNGIKPV